MAMKKTECYSVRLESMIKISDKCYKAVGFDGSEALIPASQVFGRDMSRTSDKSDSWWISSWILSKRDLQYSKKKSATFDDNGKIVPNIRIDVITPEAIEANEASPDEALLK